MTLRNSIQETSCTVQLKWEELIKPIFIINKNSDIWFWTNTINDAFSFAESEPEPRWCPMEQLLTQPAGATHPPGLSARSSGTGHPPAPRLAALGRWHAGQAGGCNLQCHCALHPTPWAGSAPRSQSGSQRCCWQLPWRSAQSHLCTQTEVLLWEGRLGNATVSPAGEVSNSSDGWLLVFRNSHLRKSSKARKLWKLFTCHWANLSS